MSSRNATIAEAVKAFLNVAANGGGLSEQFEAVRVYDNQAETKAFASLSVVVFGGGEQNDFMSRGSTRHNVVVTIGVRQQLPGYVNPTSESANAWLDAKVEFVEALADLFGPSLDFAGAHLFDSTLTFADAAHLREQRTFLGVIALTFFIAS